MVADLLTQIETKGEEKKEGNGLCIKHERNKISVSRADDFEYEEIIQPTPRKDDRKAFRKLFERERESEKCIGRKNISRPLERKFHERAVESCTHCSIINKNHDTSIKERWGRKSVRRGKPIGRNINFEPTTDLKSWKVSTSFATTEIEDRRRAKREIEWRKKKHSEKSERKDYLEMLRSFANLVKI